MLHILNKTWGDEWGVNIENNTIINLIKRKTRSKNPRLFCMKDEEKENEGMLPDLTDPEEARKAIIASTILERKYK